MIQQVLWMLLSAGLAVMSLYIGFALNWNGVLPYLTAAVLLPLVAGFVFSYQGFRNYWHAWPEQRLYQRLHEQGVASGQAVIVARRELLPEVAKSAYPLLRLDLSVAGRQAHVDVLVQPDLLRRFKPGNQVAVLCDPDNPARCAIDREQVMLQRKPASNSYGD